jgi:hypothetical protein
VNGIKLSVSSNFDEPIAVSKESGAVFNKITPNQIGLQIPAEGMLRGKSGMMAKDLINMIKGFGSAVKENNNAAIVKVGENAYFIANSGTDVYVVYGLLDVNKIDISQYQNVTDGSSSPLKRYETDDIFDIDPDMYDTYEIGGAFDTDEYDEILQQYVENAAKIAATIKTASSNPEDLQQIAELVKEAQAIGEQLEKAKGDMSPAQLSRYMEAYKLLLDAVADMK